MTVRRIRLSLSFPFPFLRREPGEFTIILSDKIIMLTQLLTIQVVFAIVSNCAYSTAAVSIPYK